MRDAAATEEENTAIALIRHLIAEGREFSITTGEPEVGARAIELLTQADVAATSGRCCRWVYLPGTGLICTHLKGRDE